jgi:exodeoxyribonuclease VII small subunit
MSKQKPFEENLKELEGCVTQMEDNELPLSEALALYKKGM